MAAVDLEAVKAQWLGVVFDEIEVTTTAEAMVGWAEACGETQARFVDPDHPDFQAHPTFAAHVTSRRIFPKDFQLIAFGKGGIDGGKAVEVGVPIRAGDRLTGRSEINDIYTKTGRSGTMVFIVHRMTFSNDAGETVATVDWRMIRQGGLDGGGDA